MAVPYRLLNNGQKMPSIGLGTWNTNPEMAGDAVFHAIKSGYRHIDCALVYGNEEYVGRGIKEAIDKGLCKREDLFLTSKLWNTYHQRDFVKKGCQLSLDNLGLDYLDLYLIHWPQAMKEGTDTITPRDKDGNIEYSDATIMDAWRGMEDCAEAKLTRSIGLSNFNSQQIKRVLDEGKIKPAALQVEAHPVFGNTKLFKFAQEHNIVFTAYSPLGSSERPFKEPGDKIPLEEENIKSIAEKYKKTPAQVALLWGIQRGTVVIPKSSNPTRIEENFNIFDFELTQDDMEKINAIDTGRRLLWLKRDMVREDWPFHIEF